MIFKVFPNLAGPMILWLLSCGYRYTHIIYTGIQFCDSVILYMHTYTRWLLCNYKKLWEYIWFMQNLFPLFDSYKISWDISWEWTTKFVFWGLVLHGTKRLRVDYWKIEIQAAKTTSVWRLDSVTSSKWFSVQPLGKFDYLLLRRKFVPYSPLSDTWEDHSHLIN